MGIDRFTDQIISGLSEAELCSRKRLWFGKVKEAQEQGDLVGQMYANRMYMRYSEALARRVKDTARVHFHTGG